jgi:hypothetical protein
VTSRGLSTLPVREKVLGQKQGHEQSGAHRSPVGMLLLKGNARRGARPSGNKVAGQDLLALGHALILEGCLTRKIFEF